MTHAKSLSQCPTMAELHSPGQGGPRTGGTGERRVPSGHQTDVLRSEDRALSLVPDWWDPESRSCSSLSDRKRTEGRGT